MQDYQESRSIQSSTILQIYRSINTMILYKLVQIRLRPIVKQNIFFLKKKDCSMKVFWYLNNLLFHGQALYVKAC